MTRWIFAYGSLLWRPGFDAGPPRRAVVDGYARRFFQGSPDHRGTPMRPGRVVTLVREPATQCSGCVFALPDHDAHRILEMIDVRESGGYARRTIRALLSDGEAVEAATWIAEPGNPHWLGEAPLEAMVAQMASAHGPSGSNRDYVLHLDAGLRRLDIDDPHVRMLARALGG